MTLCGLSSFPGVFHRKDRFFEGFAMTDRAFSGPFQSTALRKYEPAFIASGWGYREVMDPFVHGLANVF